MIFYMFYNIHIAKLHWTNNVFLSSLKLSWILTITIQVENVKVKTKLSKLRVQSASEGSKSML